jgi:hypothetical protein
MLKVREHNWQNHRQNQMGENALSGWSGRRESNPRMQLGKLDVSQSQPELSCKTPDLPLQSGQWVTGQKQNSSRRLRAVNKVVAHLNERWRVIECAAGIQWILQHRAGERHGTARWDDRSYCRTREALIRCCRASAGEIEPAACTTLAAYPSA